MLKISCRMDAKLLIRPAVTGVKVCTDHVPMGEASYLITENASSGYQSSRPSDSRLHMLT